MRKSDLEIENDGDYLTIVANVNRVLYEQGYGIQFIYNEKNSGGGIECYDLKRSIELIQE